ncbi:fimbrial protein [Serratia fonticola]|uniref:Major MR/P fimbria protein n=1 Tax=Serratia fonticola TaxID=47917 RepID=A0A0F7D142_SERFO|nr:fimbrial protein [Serratia fonticola]AKG68330.1 exotoxin [Serratia fonticola]CAI1534978.1 Major MR/P fimbria protein precursor [Serratia fonticola]CAI1577897.1 Major MR/P fimbria protein precursor [Serratia fonticola]CAI1852352.1 Major MR/P fimbria protein precursor [Serratia fonticola]CAI1935462.1 Major MR/P fimbria protein precursor [Serratia fonticola]
MRFSALLISLTIGLGSLSNVSQAVDNVRFRGALVADPCTLRVTDENINIDFGSIVEKYLYLNTRTLGVPLVLHLDDCDLSLGNMVKLTFSGTENSRLNGLLAISGASQTSGIGIGIETQQGNKVAINTGSYNQGLISGNNTISLRTYVQGEPDAISQKTINPGDFTASATFLLEYE